MKDKCEFKKPYILSFYQKLPRNDLLLIDSIKITLNPHLNRNEKVDIIFKKYYRLEAQIIKVMDEKCRHFTIDIEIENTYYEKERK
jgi:hypothetical protein